MYVAPIQRYLAALLLAGTPMLGAAQASQKDVVNHPEVVGLTVKGVKSVDKKDLLANLSIAESRCVSLALTPVCWISKSPLFYKRQYLDHEELARDVVRARVYYWQRGYRNTTVDTIVRPAGRRAVKVTLVVNEGAPTRVSAVEVRQQEPVLRPKDLRSRISLMEGEPLNMFELDSTRVRLRDKLWDKGYANARVDTVISVDTGTHTASVAIQIDPRFITRVRDIEVTGNDKVDTSTILKSLSFERGDIYKRSAVLESQRSLYESNLFRRAAITVTEGRRDSLKVVTVDVQEAPPREARLTAGFNTIDFVQVSGRFAHYNWLGGARQLNVDATIGNLFANTLNGRGIFYDVKNKTVAFADSAKYFKPTYSASFNVQQPWFGSPRNNLSVGAFAHRRSTPGIYVDEGYGGTGTFTRILTPKWPASLTYRFEVTKVDAGDVYYCVTNGICDSLTLRALHHPQRLSPIAFTTSADKTDNPYEPRKGFRARFDAEHASSFTISDFRYNRLSADGSAFLPIGSKSALGGHVRLGWVKALKSTAEAVGIDNADGLNDNLLHPRKRFYMGGATSVRGFAENQLGPRVLTVSPQKLRGVTDSTTQCTAVDIRSCDPNAAYIKNSDFEPRPLGGNVAAEASVEFRFPIIADFLGAVFVDGGYLAQTTDKSLPKSKTAVTPGIGARYISPVGPIRVDLGWNPIKSERLTVVTEDTVGGRSQLVTLPMQRTYAPSGGFLSHLTLHLSIGEAY